MGVEHEYRTSWREPIDVQFRRGVHMVLRGPGVRMEKEENNDRSNRFFDIIEITSIINIHV